jgi:hypothetical protein
MPDARLTELVKIARANESSARRSSFTRRLMATHAPRSAGADRTRFSRGL